METLFSEIENSLKSGNYYAALFMILAIPDICVSLRDGKTMGDKYIDWFEKELPSVYRAHMSGNDCYAFRCAVLHQGRNEILDHHTKKGSIDKFIILSPLTASHLGSLGGIYYNGVLQPTKTILNIHNFAKDMIVAARNFIVNNKLSEKNIIKIETYYDDGIIRIE